MSFDQLVHATRIYHGRFPFFVTMKEWEAKRLNLLVYLADLPRLIAEYKAGDRVPYEHNPQIKVMDQVPRIRLSSACEASTNCLYGMAEIAAQFGNKISGGLFPASFNGFRKKVEKGEYSHLSIGGWVNDLGWYRKVREIRTEWAHHSSVFIGEADGEPIMAVTCHRRPSDREEFRQTIQVTFPELSNWIQRAIETVDNYGNLLLEQFILPKYDLDSEVVSPVLDENGVPIIEGGGRFRLKRITVRQHLRQCGIEMSQ